MNAPLAKAICAPPAAAALTPLIGALVGSLPTIRPDEWFGVLGSIPFIALWSLVIGYPIALLHMALAWPFYRWLRRFWQLRWWIAGAAGGVIGALPVTVLEAAIMLVWGRENAPDFAGGYLGLPLLFAAAGMVGGLVFWSIVRSGDAEVPQP